MKANVQKALSVVVAAIGLALLVMMVVVEGEPGAIPLALILAAVEQVAHTSHTPPKTLWKHLVQWAHAVQSPTPAWA